MAPNESPIAIATRSTAPGVHAARIYEFGLYRLDVLAHALFKGRDQVTLTPKAFELLVGLIERRHRAVSKAELIQLLWPDSFVEEANLTQTIFVVRKALGETSGGIHYIKTITRHGYRFTGEVRELEAEAPPKVATLPSASAAPPGSMAPTPARRWPRSTELVVIGLIAATILGILATRRTGRVPVSGTREGAVASLAVLPFKPLSRTAGETNYLGLGMTDTLIARLGNVRQITVRPTRSVLRFAQSEQDLVQVGRALHVGYIVDGSIQQVADRIRVNVQLFDVGTGSPLWTEAFDESITDIFAVQDSIAQRVVQALVLSLTGQDLARLDRRQTENVDAYQRYIRGRYHWNRRGEADLRRSIGYFEEAIARDPKYGLAYAGLADAYNSMANWSFMPPREAYGRAQEAAAKALDIDRELTEAQVALVFARFLRERDWPAADRGFRDAIAHRPDYAPAHQWYGIYLASTGQHERAAAEVRRAAELEPLSSIIQSVLSWVLYLGRQYDEAIEQSRVTLELDPDYYAAHVYLGESYEQKGMFAEARGSLERARAISGGKPRDLGPLGHLYARAGMHAEALKILQDLERQSATAYVEPFYVALVHIGLGDTARPLDALERSQADGFPWVIHWNVSPRLDPLRGSERFQTLLRRAGLDRVRPKPQS